MADRAHRARVPVAYPDAPVGTCKHCGQGCAPTRRQHDACATKQADANDYRGAAVRREGEKQRCVDCGLVEGQTRKVPGDHPGGWKWERVKIQRDHPQELVDNGPRDWTVPRCHRCHADKTTREARRRRGERDTMRMPSLRGAGRLLLGVMLVGLALWLLADPPTYPDDFANPVALLPLATLERAVYTVAGISVVLAALYVWGRIVADRRREALLRLGDAIARETHTDPSRIAIRVTRWRKGLPVAATCHYSSLFDDAEGSPGRAKVESLIERKVGQVLDVRWRPHRDTVSWKPYATLPVLAPVGESEAPEKPHEAVTGRVEEAVRATIKGEVSFEWDPPDAVGPRSFRVAYPSTYPDEAPESRQTLVDRVNHKAPGRWRATWDTEQNTVHFERRPKMPGMIPAPIAAGAKDTWSIPFGLNETGAEVDWNLRQAPHALVVGGTGSGKTVTLRSIIVDATARGFTVFCVDPKRIELTGLRDWPGVRAVASSTEEMIALVTMLADEMDDRYSAIEAGDTTEGSLPPVLVVIDEATEFIQRANAHWKANKRGAGSEHPVVERWRSMARLGRSGRVHLVVGIQRPDAKVFGGEARDNYGFRVALGSLSEQGARMVFGRSDVGRDVPAGSKGRATVGIGEDKAMEVQTYYTPNPRACDTSERDHLEALRGVSAQGAADAVGHINPHTIAAYARAMDDPEAPLPRVHRYRARKIEGGPPAIAADPEPDWELVDVDDLADGDAIMVDENGEFIEVTFRSVVEAADEAGGFVEVEYERADGSESIAFVDDDTRIRRATTPAR